MSSLTVHRFKDRAEWLEARKNVIGGSDAGAIMGMSPYKGPVAIYESKMPGHVPEPMSGPALVGIKFEPVVRDWFAEDNPKLNVTYDGPDCMVIHPERKWQAMSPDGFVEETDGKKGVLQVKTHGKPWDHVPPEYVAQVQHEMAATDSEFAYLVSFCFGNRKIEQQRIVRDDGFIKMMNQEEEKFWQRVLERRPPPAVTDADVAERVNAMRSAIVGKEITLGSDAVVLSGNIRRLKKDVKMMAEELKGKENQLKAMIGDAEFALAGSFRWSWKLQHTKSYTVKEKSSRVLRLSGGEDDE